MDLPYWIERVIQEAGDSSAAFGAFVPHPVQYVDDVEFGPEFDRLMSRLRRGHPAAHPRHVGQSIGSAHPLAVIGYLAGMLVGSTYSDRFGEGLSGEGLSGGGHGGEGLSGGGHGGDGAAAELEREVIKQLGDMFRIASPAGRLTANAAIANLHALYVARESRPGLGIAYAAGSRPSHASICRALGVPGYPVAVDEHGRIDMEALEALVRRGPVGTVVLTVGSATTGALDPVHEAVRLKDRYGVRLHVDAAGGGFFTLLAGEDMVAAKPWAAIAQCDSVVVDPSRHALQPYGCGAVLFTRAHPGPPPLGGRADGAAIASLDASAELTSARPAAAAALWLTFRLLPPTRQGLGRILAVNRRAALRWAALIGHSPYLRLFAPPDLDTVTWFPVRPTLSSIDSATTNLAAQASTDLANPLYLSTVSVEAEAFQRRHPDLRIDADRARVLRGVVIRPEVDTYLESLHSRIESLARDGGPGPVWGAR